MVGQKTRLTQKIGCKRRNFRPSAEKPHNFRDFKKTASFATGS